MNMNTSTARNHSCITTPSRFAVELFARGFQVTASNRLLASKYAADDAREFLPTWNYTVGEVRAAPEERLTRSVRSEPIAVQVKESTPDSGRERLYTCDACITVTVEATDAYSAGEAALQLVCARSSLPANLAAYQDKVFWDKLLPIARVQFDRMAEVLRRRGFEAAVVASPDTAGARLAIEVHEAGEPVGTFSLIKHMRTDASTAPRPVPNPALHFIGEHDIEVISIPVGRPDLWFNGAPAKLSEIACLDVDSFDELFDLVVQQREEALESRAPSAHA
jgi:hypothetical protein